MLFRLAAALIAVVSTSIVSAEVKTIEIRGRLLCNGKPHGKAGLAGWPKIVQLWNAESDTPVEKIGGFEEVNNRKGIFYIKGVEAEGVPVVLKVLHHCYENPVEECYKVSFFNLPQSEGNAKLDATFLELADSLDLFESRSHLACSPF
uniref:Transthyretin-like family protein n=1 Tax=Ascaris lumbricoides TaxID=6252 RepID=A0A0M3II11_ASCLU